MDTTHSSRGIQEICFLDRSDEVFQKLEKRCRDFFRTENTTKTENLNCAVSTGSGGSRSLHIDSYVEGGIQVIIDAIRVPNPSGGYFPERVSFNLYSGNQCTVDGDNGVFVSTERVCSDINGRANSLEFVPAGGVAFDLLRGALSMFLGMEVFVGPVSDEYVRAEAATFAAFSELAGLPPSRQQVHPTSIVMEAARQIDVSRPLEEIMGVFKKIIGDFKDYGQMPFAARSDRPSDLFVCRRSAHEIIGTGFKFGCGEFAAVFLSLMSAKGIRARLVKVVSADFRDGDPDHDIGHDLVEVFDKRERRWVLADPTAGKIYRNYRGWRQFSIGVNSWIRMGEWSSNWGAGCYSKSDLTKMRSDAKRRYFSRRTPFKPL